MQAYAQDDPKPDHFTFQCSSGRLVVTDVVEHAVNTTIVLGMDVRGQVSSLADCIVTEVK